MGSHGEDRKAKKRFLSSRISDVHSEPAPGPRKLVSDDAEDEDQQARACFLKLKREVETLGVSGLGEKEQRAVESELLKKLGAKSRKAPRMPMAMGVGRKRNAAEREEQQREQERAEGILSKKKARKERPVGDRGLSALDEVFKAGVLFVRPGKKVDSKASVVSSDVLGQQRSKQRHDRHLGRKKGKGGKGGKGKKRRMKRR